MFWEQCDGGCAGFPSCAGFAQLGVASCAATTRMAAVSLSIDLFRRGGLVAADCPFLVEGKLLQVLL